MTDDQKLHGQQLATQAAIAQRNQAMDAVIELQVQNTLLQAELSELKAAIEAKESVDASAVQAVIP